MTPNEDSGRGARLSVGDAERLVRAHYGLEGSASVLSSERDQTFHIETGAGDKALLKISDSEDDRRAIAFQTGLLLHVERADAGVAVPRVLRALNGATEVELGSDKGVRTIRLLSFLDGALLAGAEGSPLQRQCIGGFLGRLNIAMAAFRHPDEEHALIWDMARAADLRGLLCEIEEPGQRALATASLDRFEQAIAPLLPGMRRQAVHNDANPGNILVDPADPAAVIGMIDFGDAARTVLAADVAIAAAYHLGTDDNPLGPAGELIAGYHAVLPLLPEEIDLLCDLMATRLMMSVTIGAWRAQRHPENRAYILRNNQAAWARLRRLACLDRQDGAAYLRRICNEIADV
ncbi:phosphotransferase [Bosea sp. LjRoot9]|uniref:phosphotransferase n=1 Tax=Bosea sp. LjRoot9 TaxID=3342341 RepID=UPI003ECDE7FB